MAEPSEGQPAAAAAVQAARQPVAGLLEPVSAALPASQALLAASRMAIQRQEDGRVAATAELVTPVAQTAAASDCHQVQAHPTEMPAGGVEISDAAWWERAPTPERHLEPLVPLVERMAWVAREPEAVQAPRAARQWGGRQRPVPEPAALAAWLAAVWRASAHCQTSGEPRECRHSE